MNKYYPLLLSILVLIPCTDIRPMNYDSGVKDKMMWASVVVGLAMTSYGFFRFLTWLKFFQPSISPSAKQEGDNNFQRIDKTVESSMSIDQAHGNTGSTQTKLMMLVGDQYVEKIIVRGLGQLLISQNSSLTRVEASITTEKVNIEKLDIIKDGNNLVIGPKNNVVIRCDQPIIYTIAMSKIPQLFMQGNVSVQFVTPIVQDRLWLNLEGNARIDCRANCSIDLKEITTSAVGSSKVYLQGVAPWQKITLKSNANYNAIDVRSSSVEIDGRSNSKAIVSLEDFPGDLYGVVKSKVTGKLQHNSSLCYKGSDPVNEVICYHTAAVKFIE